MNYTRFLAALLLFLMYTISFGQKIQPTRAETANLVTPGKVVVKLKPGHSLEDNQTNARTSSSLSSLSFKLNRSEPVFKNVVRDSRARTTTKSGIDFSLYHTVFFDRSLPVAEVINELNGREEVEYAEPVYVRKVAYEPNDSRLADQTYLEVIDAYRAWDETKGSDEVVIAIVDSGVDYLHEDLLNNLFTNEGEIPDNNIDDDDDGYIDNYYGWDFAGSDYNNIVQDNDPLARKSNISHGTSVTGCAAAVSDNGKGIAGVSFNARFMALKCSSDNDRRSNGQGYILNALEGVIYAAEHGADVINMSYGGPGYSQLEQDVMTYAAIEKGVILVAAAGNDGNDLIQYPAGYDHVLSVAATTDTDVKASFSSYGHWVDISAPGSGVFTTNIFGNYTSISGTSFSAPITAGAAGLLKAMHPEYSAFQIRQLLKQSADDIYDVNGGYVGELGNGRLNIYRALNHTTPALRVAKFSLQNAAGGIPRKGEEAIMKVAIVNELNDSSPDTELHVEQVGGTPVELADTQFTLGHLASGDTIAFEPLLIFDVPDSALYNEVLEFKIIMRDPQWKYHDEKRVKVVVNPIVTQELTLPYLLADGGDFESNAEHFISGQVTGNINLWEYGVPGNSLDEVNSGDNVWKTDLDGNLVSDDYSCALQTPVFDFSDQSKEYRLSFYKSMESAYCNAAAAVQVQYSTDGVTWIRLGSKDDVYGTNWYNKDINVACPIDPLVLPDQEGWLGNFSNEYTAYNISFLAGSPKVIFRFLLSVSGAFSQTNDDGFMIDDFQVEVLNPRAGFYASSTVGYVGKPIEFMYLSNGAETFSWDFGDGNTSSDRDPVHIFTQPGAYDISLSITGEDGYTADSTRSEYIIILPQSSAPFGLADGGDFESNQNYFTAVNVSGTPIELGSSDVSGKDGTNSGNFAWVTGLTEDQYQDESEAYLYTPEFDFTILGEYILSFFLNCSFENEWDGFIVEYTLDKGNSWTKLHDKVEEGWYTVISDSLAVFGQSVPIFSGTTNGVFEEKYTDVSFLGGNSSVGFRFKFLTDAATVNIGMAIDDFSLTGPVEGPITASFEGELVDGSSGCSGQVIEFVSNSTGSIRSIKWEFGENATPAEAEGRGPHLVTFETAGSSLIKIAVEDFAGSVLEKDTVVNTDPDHLPQVTNTSNNDGTVTLSATDGETYQWYFEDSLIEGATSQDYLATLNGNYSVEVSIGGCTKIAYGNKVLVAGLDDPELFGVYPNPVKDGVLAIDNKVRKNGLKVAIFNVGGSKIIEGQFEQAEREIRMDVSRLKSGIYLLQIQGESVDERLKVMIRND